MAIPTVYKKQAKEFFEEMAETYGGSPNVIYEICNEPNGTNVTWQEIKAYAKFIIPAIRAIAPDSVIIVGTDTWSQDVRAAAEAPLNFTNVLYALHFYAGTNACRIAPQRGFSLVQEFAHFCFRMGIDRLHREGRALS